MEYEQLNPPVLKTQPWICLL